MEELVTIKSEPEWSMNDDEYSSAQLYKAEPNISYTEYEIRPYYEGDIDFDYIKCKVGYQFWIFLLFLDIYIHCCLLIFVGEGEE